MRRNARRVPGGDVMLHSVAEFCQNENGVFVPYVDVGGELREVGWAPMPGSQTLFLQASETEVLYEGTRGGCGKSEALLQDFAQNCGVGFGAAHRGVIFRISHPQLTDSITLSRSIFRRTFPEAEFNTMKSTWEFPGGESLQFSHFPDPTAFTDWQGKQFTFIGFEELTNWPDCTCLKLMLSCLRSTNPTIPKHLRSTCNPYGRGRDAIMQRYRLPLPPGVKIGPVIADSRDEEGNLEPPRRVVHGHLNEHILLAHTDPNYLSRILGAARNESERKAWALGDWAIPPSGLFSDFWAEAKNYFIVPVFDPPKHWKKFFSYDHGSAAPYACLWFAESDGSDFQFPDGRVRSSRRGDLFVVGELYGALRPNVGLKLPIPEIARRIRQYEAQRGWKIKDRVADTNIFDNDNDRPSIADDFEKSGLWFEPAAKGPGSLKQGIEQVRKLLMAAVPPVGGIRESPALFVVDSCVDWYRSVSNLQTDERDPETMAPHQDDHLFDATVYGVRRQRGAFIKSSRISVCA